MYKVKALEVGRKAFWMVIGIEHRTQTEIELVWTHDGKTHVEISLGRLPAEAKKHVDERVRELKREHGWGRYKVKKVAQM